MNHNMEQTEKLENTLQNGTEKVTVEREVAAMMDDEEAARIAVAAVDELAEKDQQIAVLQEELGQMKDMLTRQVADFQNYRRRMEQESSRQKQFGREEVLVGFLEVYDDFRRSMDAAEKVEAQAQSQPAFNALKSGVALIFENFGKQLSRLSVEAIPAVGHPFDENLHEALMQQPAPEGTESGIVLMELQTGYKIGDRVIRHAKVIVAA
ncbi:MAG TPA: nucleotide exchange factor GrpE [Rhodothermales bacterium]|nr:nucleotide exchange factor GrpE [Rhodothermales bacterium]HRR08149.1 nucleotide exchange factor GrpE [Rhodothermales bacterium]